ncbi:MFS transporter [Aeromonas sp.]|uniref:MFS transporter n=1 Tax=Aeromonas sp. TaxID=647 RepID=UPI00257FA3E3|nr:MFS transporter [Aeromonas sp.]
MRKIPPQINFLFVFNGLSILGNAITEVAIPWLILEISGSPLLVAGIMSAKILPVVLSIFFSAQLVDRYSAYRVSVISDMVNFVSVLLIPVFFVADVLNFYLLALLLLFSTILDSPGRLAKDVILAKEISKTKSENELINGVNSTIENVCDLIGPVIASLIIATLGVVNALYFDAISFLIVALGLIILKKHFTSCIDKGTIVAFPGKGYIFDSVKYIIKNNDILSILILSAIVNLVVTPFLLIYLPYLNKVVYDSVLSLGISMTIFGTGTTLASLGYGIIAKRYSSERIIIFGYTLLLICFIVLNQIHNQYILFATLFFIGMSVGMTGPVEVTMIQKRVNEKMFSRVMTIFTSVRFLFVPVGCLLVGVSLETKLAIGVPYILSCIVGLGLLSYLLISKKSSVSSSKINDFQ